MTSRIVRPDALDFSHMRPGRSSSFSSDVMSTSARSAGTTVNIVPAANPAPAYIAQAEGSDLISAELDRKVVIAPAALTLLNEFLDHVLYSIICASHSVSLGALKAAVPAVLKPRLGKAALRVAEEELKEYMEDEEAEELSSNKSPVQPKSNFDVELVWKLARLRCMVYARMGDLEEEDEEEWLEKEHLLEQAVNSPVSTRQSMVVTPGSAIFLTSVIEYLGEQALYYSAQYAQRRHDHTRSTEYATDPESALNARHAEILLEAKDMNHVGRDSPLSRLWRSWRRNQRSAIDSASRPISPDASLSPATETSQNRVMSSVAAWCQPIVEEASRTPLTAQAPLTPTRIPLPGSDSDDIDLLDEEESTLSKNKRPNSMPVMPGSFLDDPESPVQERPAWATRASIRPELARIRSNSMPNSSVAFEMPRSEDRDSLALPIQKHDTQETDQEVVQPLEEQSPPPQHKQDEIVQQTPSFIESDTAIISDSSNASDQKRHPVHRPSASMSRTKTPQSSEQLNATVGVLAGALGAVGVHHIGRTLQQSNSFSAGESQSRLTPSDEETTMSASIRGPTDLRHSYVPVGRTSPEDSDNNKSNLKVQPTAKPKSDRSPQPSPIQAHFDELATRQYHEHRAYSAGSHTMETPSIYSQPQHAPRFPQDMRPVSTVSSRYSAILDMDSDMASSPVGLVAPTGKAFMPTQQNQHRSAESLTAAKSLDDVSKSSASPTLTKKTTPPKPVQIPVDEYVEQGRTRSHSKSSSSSSRLLGFTRDQEGRPQTIHQQRAAGGMSDDVRQAYSSTANGPGPAQKRPDTAVSRSSPPRRQQLRLRNGSDNNVLKTRPSEESAKRSLEGLINSDETLHYTLTPVTATFREDDLNRSSPRHPPQNFEFIRTTPIGQENATPRNLRSAESKEAVGSVSKTVTKVTNVIVSKPPPPKNRNPLGVPRDAKVDRMSGVRDLADYMRSTGPSNDDQLPRALGGGIARPPPAQPGYIQSPSRLEASAISRPANRLKFQARDARPSRNAESSALIDFIREGPPREQGDHRINRHVAPFRTTMDSDDLNSLAKSLPQHSPQLSGMLGSDAATLNSITPLLTNSGAPGSSSQAPSTYDQTVGDGDSGMPKRTQKRTKDPYAIDDSDDEMFNEVPPLRSNEESLIDFLRNTAPSQSMTAQPILASPSSAPKTLDRTPSADRLRDFVRGARSGSMTSDRTAQLQEQSRMRSASPHLTQSGSKLDTYRPTSVTHASHIDRNRANKVSNRPISRTESRASTIVERGSTRGFGATADLADYLRNTGPPPSNNSSPQPFVLNGKAPGQKKSADKEGGLKKFFSVRSRK